MNGLRGCSALTLLGGILAFQVSGWFLGVRIFATLNAEAMLTVFLVTALGIFGLMMFRLEDTDSSQGPGSRSIIVGFLTAGLVAGVLFRNLFS